MTVGALKTIASFPRKPPLFVCVGFVWERRRGRESSLNKDFLNTWAEVGDYAFTLLACRELVILKF